MKKFTIESGRDSHVVWASGPLAATRMPAAQSARTDAILVDDRGLVLAVRKRVQGPDGWAHAWEPTELWPGLEPRPHLSSAPSAGRITAPPVRGDAPNVSVVASAVPAPVPSDSAVFRTVSSERDGGEMALVACDATGRGAA